MPGLPVTASPVAFPGPSWEMAFSSASMPFPPSRLPAFPPGTLRVPTRLSSAAAVLRLLQILAALHSSWLGRGLCSGGAWHKGAPGPGRGVRGPACHTASGPLCTLRSNACGGFPDALGPLSRWPDSCLGLAPETSCWPWGGGRGLRSPTAPSE